MNSAIISNPSKAGSFERGDALVEIFPAESGIDIILNSTAISQYGKSIRALVHKVLMEYGIKNIRIIINDNSALDFALRSRVETAIIRSLKQRL